MILMEGGAARDLYYTTTRWRARPDYHSRVCHSSRKWKVRQRQRLSVLAIRPEKPEAVTASADAP